MKPGENATRWVTSADGTKIAFEKAGNGWPVIFVDGAMCSRSLGPMRPLSELLSKNFTVYIYDRRGRGNSGNAIPYAVEREIEDIQALITEAGGSAFLFGMSSGAALAIKAVNNGLNVPKLALYEPPFMVGDTSDRPPVDHKQRLSKFIANDRRSDAAKFFMGKIVGMPAFIIFIMRLLPVWSKIKAAAHTLPYDAAIMGDYSLPAEQIRSIQIPSIVIGGAKSPAVLRNAVTAVADTIPGAEQNLLRGQTHNISAKALAPVLQEFFGK